MIALLVNAWTLRLIFARTFSDLQNHILLTGLRFVYDKISVTLFFLSEKRLSAPNAGTIYTIAEECFSKEMCQLGWSADYKIEQERAVVGDFNYRLMFSYINNSKAHWSRNDDVSEEDLCKCIMCESYS